MTLTTVKGSVLNRGVNVKDFGAVGDGVTDDTAALRLAFDEALSFLMGGAIGVTVLIPDGSYLVTDELFSDDFQSKWWLQTGLLKQKFLTIEGLSAGGTEIKVSPSYVSSVRNTANGNQRAYGPFSGQPSPSCLFPIMASTSGGAPAALSLRNLRLKGSNVVGKDPVAIMSASELDASMENLHVVNFANWGHVILSTFNSVHLRNHYESCGLQPTESGAILGWDAGFPEQPSVKFDYNATTNVVTAKAAVAFGAYAVDDAVPYFYTAHVGKEFVINQAGVNSTITSPLRVTISTVASDGVSTATVTPTSTDQNATGVAASFLPLKATTNGTTSITLSAPLLVGSGAADMVGQLVAIPKAKSVDDPEKDLFVSRIASCDMGNDTDGYTVISLQEACSSTITDDFIYAGTLGIANDETISAAGNTFSNANDTDFISCRYEHSSGYSSTDVSTASYILVVSGAGESVQFISCKFHGAPSVRGMFATDGSAVLDSSVGLYFVGCTFTHMTYRDIGQIRLTGSKNITRFTNCDVGGFYTVDDLVLFYFDPMSGYDADDWSVSVGNPYAKIREFPAGSQAMFGQRSGLSNIDRLNLMSDETSTKNSGATQVTALDSSDDLDNLFIPGNYSWKTSSPTNAPGFPNYSSLTVSGGRSVYVQTMFDTDNDWIFVRDWNVSWGPWRLIGSVRQKATTAFQDVANDINTIGKHFGQMALSSTDSKLYIARGSNASDVWISADGVTTLTPV